MDKDRKKNLRLLVLMLCIFMLFSFILSQFYHLQITEGEKWTEKARKQHFFTVKAPFLRGRFFSNGTLKRGHPDTTRPLTCDIEKYHLHIDAVAIPEALKEEVSNQLAYALAAEAGEKEHFQTQLKSKSRNRRVAHWLNKPQKTAVLHWWGSFAKKQRLPRNALFFVADYQRCYPFGKLLGQLLHTIREHKEGELPQSLPTGGLELYFNSYLQGRAGKQRLMRSPRHSFETGETLSPPINGADIYLTINHYLQAIAEEEIEKGVKKTHAKHGWAVMMEPHTGEIWAIAQYPFFDPSHYKDYFNDKTLIEHTQLRAISDAIEPGSVFKPFTLCVALLANEYLASKGEALLFNPEEKIATSCGKFPGRSKPLQDVSYQRFLNFNMSLQKSSNIYVAKLIERVISRLGNEWYRSVLAEIFGLGKKTGIEYPAETAGLLPSIGKRHANGSMEWSLATPPSMAMGYNLQMNSIQLLRAYALLANGGRFVKPTFIRRIVKQENGAERVLLENKHRAFPQVLGETIIRPVVNAMKYTTKPGGSAPKAEIYGYTEAGKTSTVHKLMRNGQYGNTHRALFIGFTPVKDPAFILLVAIDEPEVGFLANGTTTHRGGASAAPIFRAIATKTLEYLGIPPDDPGGYHPTDPRYDPHTADWIFETRQLLDRLREWNKS